MTPRPARALRAAAALAASAALLLAGCSSSGDRLADDFREGTGAGYISGDGAYTLVAESERGEPVVFTSELETGEPISSDDLAGQVYVVNFWYASCPPCRVEAPDLQALYEEFGEGTEGQPDGVPFIGVNTRDGAATSIAFAEEFGVTYPSIVDARDGAVRLAFAGQVAPNAVPTTLVVDAQGRVAARVSGLLTEPSTLRAMIRDTIAEAG